MVKTMDIMIYLVFALVGAALILYFVINALPDIKQEPITAQNTARGLFGTCDNATSICALGDSGLTTINKMRCEVQLTEVLCHHACPCP